MKCPKCGGKPDNMVLTSNPLKYRCSECGYVGPEGPWMEHARQAHAERLQAARGEVEQAECDFGLDLEPSVVRAIAALIDAKVELALLERGS